jgi:hypothetical protein
MIDFGFVLVMNFVLGWKTACFECIIDHFARQPLLKEEGSVQMTF